ARADLVALHALHAQFEVAVVEQHALAAGDVVGEAAVARADADLTAAAGFPDHSRSDVDDDLSAALQVDRFGVLQPADADLGALQVGQDADRAARLARDAADRLDRPRHGRMIGVGAIEAEHVD